ncbi:unnamed protein product [Rhizoctonia solani]|uniref:PIH1 N-terminal domain-containing protein n=1 Tax=Rhizoctonia solani TaxID=456999 RepID=A0A8H3HGL3_9AGAM|nr:unnamed protein product [Rhizoctonia solani]
MNSPPSSHGQSAVPVELTPDPGFCVKTRVQPDGHKLFVNICHHPAIPSAEGHLPLVLSERRDGTDKAGQPSIIFDVIFNPTICSKAAKDPELRGTLIGREHVIGSIRLELISSRGRIVSNRGEDWVYVESKYVQILALILALVITPQLGIATPNIKFKGDITPRTARIPAFWATAEDASSARIKELDTAVPLWTWSPTREGCRIVIQVPDLTKSLYASSTLDLEARRLIFTAGSRYHLDTPLLPPNQGTRAPVGGTKFLPTTIDPDSAVAEWNVKNKELVVQIKWTSVVAREKEKEQDV